MKPEAALDHDYLSIWEPMELHLYATGREWLARRSRGKGITRPHSQGSPVPCQAEPPASAVVRLYTEDVVSHTHTRTIHTYRGRLHLLGLRVHVSVDAYDKEFPGTPHEPALVRALSMASLSHPNIQPVLGVGTLRSGRKSGSTALVVPDLAGTDLRTHLKHHPDAEKRRLIVQIAEALDYLHNQSSVIYGRLGPHYVFVDRLGGVTLQHPGMVAVKDDRLFPYTAPEIVLAGDDDTRVSETRQSDMYGFGMLVYEILSGREPWEDAALVSIFRYIVSSQLLPRPEDGTIDDSMWNLCVACWNPNPSDRPSVANVLAGLRDDVPPSRWRPDRVVGGDQWTLFERPSRMETSIPTELEVEINGSVVTLSIPKEAAISGAFGTVMRGYSYEKGSVQVYALKFCRDTRVMPREYEIWKSLSHPNILRLLGTVDTATGDRVFVSDYIERGHINGFLDSASELWPSADHLSLMIDVAKGLEYLHNVKRIIHGDIKPENILITSERTAVLADFGLSTYVAPRREETPPAVRQLYTLAYCAPEVLDDTAEDPSAQGVIRSKTKMSDIFAYGLLLFQTYAGELGRSKRDRIELMLNMYDGQFPPRPVGRRPVLCDELWSICTRCWLKVPLQRPPIAVVLAELQYLERSPLRQAFETVDSYIGPPDDN